MEQRKPIPTETYAAIKHPDVEVAYAQSDEAQQCYAAADIVTAGLAAYTAAQLSDRRTQEKIRFMNAFHRGYNVHPEQATPERMSHAFPVPVGIPEQPEASVLRLAVDNIEGGCTMLIKLAQRNRHAETVGAFLSHAYGQLLPTEDHPAAHLPVSGIQMTYNPDGISLSPGVHVMFEDPATRREFRLTVPITIDQASRALAALYDPATHPTAKKSRQMIAGAVTSLEEHKHTYATSFQQQMKITGKNRALLLEITQSCGFSPKPEEQPFAVQGATPGQIEQAAAYLAYRDRRYDTPLLRDARKTAQEQIIQPTLNECTEPFPLVAFTIRNAMDQGDFVSALTYCCVTKQINIPNRLLVYAQIAAGMKLPHAVTETMITKHFRQSVRAIQEKWTQTKQLQADRKQILVMLKELSNILPVKETPMIFLDTSFPIPVSS